MKQSVQYRTRRRMALWSARLAHALPIGATFGMAMFLCGCTVGPKYVRPAVETPASFKEAANFKPAQPADQLPKGKWWEIYGDNRLNQLEEEVSVSIQNLKAAQSQFAAARAAVRISRASYFPAVTGGLTATRLGQSENRAL